MVMDLRHRRHQEDYQEVRRQRIPKVGHQDFTARPLARFQYLVRIYYLRDKTNRCYTTNILSVYVYYSFLFFN